MTATIFSPFNRAAAYTGVVCVVATFTYVSSKVIRIFRSNIGTERTNYTENYEAIVNFRFADGSSEDFALAKNSTMEERESFQERLNDLFSLQYSADCPLNRKVTKLTRVL